MECTSDEVNINNELITIDTKIHDPKKYQSLKLRFPDLTISLFERGSSRPIVAIHQVITFIP